MQKYYTLDTPRSPWGDYSRILVKGMSCHSARRDGLIQLERTGPYIPPITFPGIGDIVVSDVFRRELERSGLVGLSFQPVIKKHIAHLDWHTWDRSADAPEEYPKGGEPESYILGRPHSPETAASMGDLWEVLIAKAATVQRERKPSRILLVKASLTGEDLFRAEGVGYIYATEKAKAWFDQHAADHVSFREVEVV